MRKVFMGAAAASMMFAAPVSAGVVYSNNFDAENGGVSALNYTGFNGLTITDGTVDLVKSGDFGITCKSGSCVDLDGSTNNAGLASSNSYAFGAGQRVDFNFSFSGNQRIGTFETFDVGFVFSGITGGIYGYEANLYGAKSFAFSGPSIALTLPDIPPGRPFVDFTFYFVPDNAGSASFYFQNAGADNIGVVLDNVSLSITAVPEPSTWAMMILGFGAVGAAARRRKAAGVAAFA